jgi:hypothetical protein
VNVTPAKNMCPNLDFGCPQLETVFSEYTQRINEAVNTGKMLDVQAVLLIEEWQLDLVKVTPRIVYTDPKDGVRKTYERVIYLHRERGGE